MASETKTTTIQVSEETHKWLKTERRIKKDGELETLEEVIRRLVGLETNLN